VKIAKEEGKFIFVDAYTNYCQPCKLMDRHVFNTKDVAVYYNKHFINYKADMEKEENNFFVAEYGVEYMPTLLYLTADGQLIQKDDGGKGATDFLAFGKKAVNTYKTEPQLAKNPPFEVDLPQYEDINTNNFSPFRDNTTETKHDYQFISNDAIVINTKPDIIEPLNEDTAYLKLIKLEKMYHSRGRENCSPQLLCDYAYLLKKHHQPCNAVVNDYLNTQKNNLDNEINRAFVYDFAFDLENNSIEYFLKDIGYYKQKYDSRVINEKISRAVNQTILIAIEEHDDYLFNQAVNVIKKAHLPHEDALLFKIQALYYEGVEDWANYVNVTSKYIESNNIDDAKLLTNVVWVYQQYVKDKKALRKAEDWIEKSVIIERAYYNYYTYASLLYKQKRYVEAEEKMDKAIEIFEMQYKRNTPIPALRLKDKIQAAQN